jgi:hypothetical protein
MPSTTGHGVQSSTGRDGLHRAAEFFWQLWGGPARRAGFSGHQNGHQTSKKWYSWVMTDLLDFLAKSAMFEAQSRHKLANPGHWLHFQLRVQQEFMKVTRKSASRSASKIMLARYSA